MMGVARDRRRMPPSAGGAAAAPNVGDDDSVEAHRSNMERFRTVSVHVC
jgi:hypothetical protein